MLVTACLHARPRPARPPREPEPSTGWLGIRALARSARGLLTDCNGPLCPAQYHSGNRASGAAIAASIASALVLVTASAVSFVAPVAAGSGLPEVASYLNGAPPLFGTFQLRTLLVKTAGLAMVIAGGVPVGREGPMIHIGGSMAWNLSSLLKSSGNHSQSP